MVNQFDAVCAALEALSLGPEYAAHVAFCKGIAAQLDEHPERATLWREYLPALNVLVALGGVEADDGEAALLKLVSTPMGDPTKVGAGESGAGGREGRRVSGSAADAVAAAGRGCRPGVAS